MRATLLVESQIRNPVWNEAAAKAASDSGREYDVPALVSVAPGFVLEGDDCWIHCCPGDMNAQPIAEPACDACREAVRVWMETRRPAAIESIRNALANLSSFKNPQDRDRLTAMGRAYGLIGGEAAASPKKPAKA